MSEQEQKLREFFSSPSCYECNQAVENLNDEFESVWYTSKSKKKNYKRSR